MRDRFARLLLSAWLGCATTAAIAARWQAFDVESGLPQNSATALAVDRFGLLWVGTEDGLARFDGSRFVAFDHAVDRGWLPGNYIVALAADDEAVWIAVESGGIARFDLLHERFEPVAARDPVDGQPLDAAMLRIDGDRVWVGTREHGLVALDRRHPDRVVAHWSNGGDVPPERRLPLRAVLDVSPDPQRGGYWVAGMGGLVHIDPARGHVEIDGLTGIPRSPSDVDVANVMADSDGTLWLGSRSHGVWRRRPGDAAFTAIPIATPNGESVVVNRLARYGLDQLSAATDRGLLLHDRGCDCFVPAAPSPQLRQVLGGAMLISVIGDGDTVWAGSWNRGLFRFDPRSPGFDLLTPHELGAGDHPMSPRALFVDRDRQLWVGTFGDGVRYAPIRDTPMREWAWRDRVGSGEPRDRQIWAFAQTANGDLYVGSDLGLSRWRGPDVNTLDLVPKRMDEVRSLIVASDGQLWASTVGGLFRIDPQSHATRRYARAEGLNDLRAYSLAEWPKGRLVIGTWSGLYTLSMQDDRVVPMPLHRAGQRDEARLIWDFQADARGGLWIGTSSGLLHLDDPADSTVTRYAEADGLPNAVVYAIEPGADDHLWLSTNRGLARFDPRSGRAIAFDARDGLQGDEFGFALAAHDSDGQVYFGGQRGISRFDPRRIRPQDDTPTVLIRQFFLSDRAVVVGEPSRGRIVLPQSLLATERIALEHREADLGFAFSALTADSPAHLRFQYRLDGKDSHWMDAADRRYVGYTNLSAGHYRFRVRALSRTGREGPERGIDIDIAPAPWDTLPFRFGVALAALLLAWMGLRWRFATLHRSRAQLADAVARQTEHIREQTAQLERANRALYEQSVRDPLTGAFNRRHVIDAAEQSLRAAQAEHRAFAVLLIDVDHFKQVNDRYGHATGDAVLCALVRTAQATLDGIGTLARFGGEEFIVVLPDHDVAAAERVAQRLRTDIAALHVDTVQGELRITVSIGIAATGAAIATLDALIARADAALYRAKANGRDRIDIADPR